MIRLRSNIVVSTLSFAACSLLVGCAEPSDDIVGPFSDASHRFVVDRIVVPTNNAHARELADDLDGDGVPDNQLGSVIGSLSTMGVVTTHAQDLIASGILASTVEIQADDLVNDDRAGVWYFGAADSSGTPVGGAFTDGVFSSNRTRTTSVPGQATVRLPVFKDADPAQTELVGMEIDLVPDGRGGYDGWIHGGVPSMPSFAIARDGIVQMLDADPRTQRGFWSLVDSNHDGTFSMAEATSSDGPLAPWLAPDVKIPGFHASVLSLGFQVHLSACESGRCGSTTTVSSCFDRVRGGDETGIDCGGSCRACGGGQACAVPADCQSGRCDGGTCQSPSCSDARLDGFESDVDCGGACSACAVGQQCMFDRDCTTGHCRSNNRCNY